MLPPGYYFFAAGSQFTKRGSKHIATYNVRIEDGPHVDARDRWGWTPLQGAEQDEYLCSYFSNTKSR